LGSSEEEEGDGLEGEEDWQSAGEEGGNSGGVRANSEGFGDETWELFCHEHRLYSPKFVKSVMRFMT
jgi:hypothetical protein